MTDLKNFTPVQINTLYGFNNVKDFYWFVEELSVRLNIPRQTLYCRYYAQTPGRKIQSVKLAQRFYNRSTD